MKKNARTAIVLGGADCLIDDAMAAVRFFTPDVWVACNHAGRDWPGRVDHWCTMHPDLMQGWRLVRRRAGLEPAAHYWCPKGRATAGGMRFHQAESWGGSSGLLAATVAMTLGASRVILCGIPLQREFAHYDDRKPWMEAHRYRAAWIRTRPRMHGIVRSMSGWSAELLGRPDEDWAR